MQNLVPISIGGFEVVALALVIAIVALMASAIAIVTLSFAKLLNPSDSRRISTSERSAAPVSPFVVPKHPPADLAASRRALEVERTTILDTIDRFEFLAPESEERRASTRLRTLLVELDLLARKRETAHEISSLARSMADRRKAILADVERSKSKGSPLASLHQIDETIAEYSPKIAEGERNRQRVVAAFRAEARNPSPAELFASLKRHRDEAARLLRDDPSSNPTGLANALEGAREAAEILDRCLSALVVLIAKIDRVEPPSPARDGGDPLASWGYPDLHTPGSLDVDRSSGGGGNEGGGGAGECVGDGGGGDFGGGGGGDFGGGGSDGGGGGGGDFGGGGASSDW